MLFHCSQILSYIFVNQCRPACHERSGSETIWRSPLDHWILWGTQYLPSQSRNKVPTRGRIVIQHTLFYRDINAYVSVWIAKYSIKWLSEHKNKHNLGPNFLILFAFPMIFMIKQTQLTFAFCRHGTRTPSGFCPNPHSFCKWNTRRICTAPVRIMTYECKACFSL